MEAGAEKQREIKVRRLLIQAPKPYINNGFVGSLCKYDIMKATD